MIFCARARAIIAREMIRRARCVHAASSLSSTRVRPMAARASAGLVRVYVADHASNRQFKADAVSGVKARRFRLVFMNAPRAICAYPGRPQNRVRLTFAGFPSPDRSRIATTEDESLSDLLHRRLWCELYEHPFAVACIEQCERAISMGDHLCTPQAVRPADVRIDLRRKNAEILENVIVAESEYLQLRATRPLQLVGRTLHAERQCSLTALTRPIDERIKVDMGKIRHTA